MCIRFSEKQLSDFSKNIIVLLQDNTAYSLFQQHLQPPRFKDHLKALTLWKTINEMHGTEVANNMNLICDKYDDIDSIEVPFDPESEDVEVVQKRCIELLNKIYSNFMDHLHKKHKKCT